MSDTDRTDRVIDAIDGALEDYSVSGDAMRWTAEPGPEPVSTVHPVLSGPVVPDEQGRATPSWMRGLRVIEDPAVPPGEVWLTVDTEMPEMQRHYATRLLPATHAEARVEQGLFGDARAALIERMAAHYGLPACLIEHRFSPWRYDPDRYWYRRDCTREGCTHWEAQHASLGMPQR